MALSTNNIAYYKFDNGALTTDSIGSYGLTNNGTVAGSASGVVTYAADYGSSNTTKYFSNASQLGLTINAARTISLWVNVTTAPTSGNVASILSMTYTTGAVGYTVDYWNSAGTLKLRVGRFRDTIDDPPMLYTQTLTLGTWYHIVYTFDGAGNEVLFLNGVQVATYANVTTNGTGTSLPNAFNIGRNTAFGRYLSGLTDEVGIWSRVLTASEVSQLFNSGRGNTYPLTDTPSLYGAIAHYKFDNGLLTTDSINSYTLTNTGTVANTASGKQGFGADFGSTNTTKWFTQNTLPFNTYPITISGWFKPSIVNDNGNLFSLGEATVHYYQMKLRNTDSHIVFRSNNATDAADVDTGVVASAGNWYHVVLVINSTTNVDIYVNGTATNTSATSFVAPSLSKFAIAALARGTPIQPYSGLCDEVTWFNRALTSTEVTSLYAGGSGLAYPFNPSGVIPTYAAFLLNFV